MTEPITLMPTVGLDVSEKYVQSCEMTPLGEVVETARFTNSSKKLQEKFAPVEPRRIVLETGSHAPWMGKLLEELGHKVLVVDTRRLKLVSGTLYKDDKIDAEMLAMLGITAPQLLKTVEIRDEDCQRALTIIRGRASAVEARTKLINTVRGLLKPHGQRVTKSGASATFPNRVREEVDAPFLGLVEPLLKAIEALHASIADYDRTVEDLLPKLAPDAVHLTQVKGVGVLTVLYFVALIGSPKRFANSRKVGSFLGLCRRRDDSGDYKSALRITKAGDPYMRALLTNCAAHILGPHGQDSDLRTWGLRLVGGGSRAEKKKAKVAVARKLAVLLLTLWKTGEPYDPFRNSKRHNAAAA